MLKERYPQTVIPMSDSDFDLIKVLRSSQVLGYDPSTSGLHLEVSGTPMIAVVVHDTVVTFFAKDQAISNLKNKGWLFTNRYDAA